MTVRIVSPDRHQARLCARRLSLSRILLGAYCISAPVCCLGNLECSQLFPIDADYLPSSYFVDLMLVDEGFGLVCICW